MTKLIILVLSRMAFAFFYLLHLSYRYRYYNFDFRNQARDFHPKGSFMLALWHEHLFASMGAHSFQGLSPIISQSKDGDIVSYVATAMGMRPVRGSSSRGGKAASEELEKKVFEGLIGAITVDGPRGPRRLPKAGIIRISNATRTMILPSVALASRYWTLTSWDQFKIPKPFATIAVLYGQAYVAPEVHSKAEIKSECDRLAQIINDLDTDVSKLINDKSKSWISRRQVFGQLSRISRDNKDE